MARVLNQELRLQWLRKGEEFYPVKIQQDSIVKGDRKSINLNKSNSRKPWVMDLQCDRSYGSCQSSDLESEQHENFHVQRNSESNEERSCCNILASGKLFSCLTKNHWAVEPSKKALCYSLWCLCSLKHFISGSRNPNSKHLWALSGSLRDAKKPRDKYDKWWKWIKKS